MTENNAQEIVEETVDKVESKLTRLKNRIKKIDGKNVAIAGSAVIAVVGMVILGRQEKTVIHVETDTLVIDPEPATEVTATV